MFAIYFKKAFCNEKKKKKHSQVWVSKIHSRQHVIYYMYMCA